MNTTALCDRFEREAILRIERGEPLDPHFDDCAPCIDARRKHERILAALPDAAPWANLPIGWQARVLAATGAEKERAPRRTFAPRPFAPEVLASVCVALALVAGSVELGSRDVSVDVTGEPAPEPRLAVVEMEAPETPLVEAVPEERVAPTGDGDVKTNDARPLAPRPVAPAPLRRPREIDEPLAPPPPAPPLLRNLIAEAHVIAPVEAPDEPAQAATQPAPAHRVARPNKLYGFSLKYPRRAMQMEIQGEVSAQCTVRRDGRNTNCRILNGLPFLDEPVLEALRASRSDPIRVDGKPVDNSDHIWRISITLRDPTEQPMMSRNVPVIRWKNGI